MRRAVVALAVVGVACQGLVDTDLGAGIGAPCLGDDDCQGSICSDRICTRTCGDDAGCPGGTICADEICELPMRVGYVYPFPIAQDELAQSFDLGRLGAETEHRYVTSVAVDDKPLAPDATDAALGLVAEGASVIAALSPAQAPAFAALADANPDVAVVGYASPVVSERLTSLEPRMYQAYYLAGVAAARKTLTNRFGMIASVASPEIVSRVNAFALGARRSLGATPFIVEVRWIGDWHDTGALVMGEKKERRDTRDLIINGADVVAHTLDNNIPLYSLPELALEGHVATAVAANLAAACDAEGVANLCVGSAYFNWAPMLGTAFHAIQRDEGGGRLRMGLGTNEAQSAVGFRVGAGATAGLAQELDNIRAELVQGDAVGAVFKGPIESDDCAAQTGNSPCVATGATLDEAALARMCWFIDGVIVERDPTGTMDLPGTVPAACLDGLPD